MDYYNNFTFMHRILTLIFFIYLVILAILIYMLFNFNKFKYNLLIYLIFIILMRILIFYKIIPTTSNTESITDMLFYTPDFLDTLYYVVLPNLILIIILVFFPLSNVALPKNSVKSNINLSRSTVTMKNNNAKNNN